MVMENLPRHIAIIPDGNRRCAKRLMLQPWKGHEWGARKMEEVFGWCKEMGIRDITFYTLSLENLENRPNRELDRLLDIAKRELEDVNTKKDNFVHKNRVKLHFFGEIERLPRELQDEIDRAQDNTKSYSDYRINCAVAYGGRQEILNACRKLVAERHRPEAINDGMLRRCLQTNGSGDPDLIIRTGGDRRFSNFLLYQAAYAELFFIDSFWPDLKKEEFLAAIKDFSGRKRRFGK